MYTRCVAVSVVVRLNPENRKQKQNRVCHHAEAFGKLSAVFISAMLYEDRNEYRRQGTCDKNHID